MTVSASRPDRNSMRDGAKPSTVEAAISLAEPVLELDGDKGENFASDDTQLSRAAGDRPLESGKSKSPADAAFAEKSTTGWRASRKSIPSKDRKSFDKKRPGRRGGRLYSSLRTESGNLDTDNLIQSMMIQQESDKDGGERGKGPDTLILSDTLLETHDLKSTLVYSNTSQLQGEMQVWLSTLIDQVEADYKGDEIEHAKGVPVLTPARTPRSTLGTNRQPQGAISGSKTGRRASAALLSWRDPENMMFNRLNPVDGLLFDIKEVEDEEQLTVEEEAAPFSRKGWPKLASPKPTRNVIRQDLNDAAYGPEKMRKPVGTALGKSPRSLSSKLGKRKKRHSCYPQNFVQWKAAGLTLDSQLLFSEGMEADAAITDKAEDPTTILSPDLSVSNTPSPLMEEELQRISSIPSPLEPYLSEANAAVTSLKLALKMIPFREADLDPPSYRRPTRTGVMRVHQDRLSLHPSLSPRKKALYLARRFADRTEREARTQVQSVLEVMQQQLEEIENRIKYINSEHIKDPQIGDISSRPHTEGSSAGSHINGITTTA